MTRFCQAFNLYSSPRGVGWSFEPWTLPKPSTKSRFAFVVSRIVRALGCTLLGAFASVGINSSPALSGKTASVRDMGWFYHTAGAFAFTLGAVTHINALHCVLAALCVGVGVSRPQSGWICLGAPFMPTVCRSSGGVYNGYTFIKVLALTRAFSAQRGMVDLPHPDGPKMATFFPAGTVKERLLNMGLVGLYAKETFSKRMKPPCRCRGGAFGTSLGGWFSSTSLKRTSTCKSSASSRGISIPRS